MPRDRADTLANGFFGLYTAADRTHIVADNIRVLWPRLWPFVSEPARTAFGLRHARARASAETGIATAARELIDLVDGAAYLTDEVRAIEIDQALDDLMTAHNGMNNFYTESTPARRLAGLVGQQGGIPGVVQSKFVDVVVEAYLGNGYGVSWAAEPHYRQMLETFDGQLAGRALRVFLEPAISSLLWNRTAQAQWVRLLDILEPKLTSTTDRTLIEAIRSFAATPDKLKNDSRIERLAREGLTT